MARTLCCTSVRAVSISRAAEAQVVLGHRVGDGVALTLDMDSAAAQPLLDGVDAHVDAAGRARQLASDRGLSDAGGPLNTMSMNAWRPSTSAE
jgi:hypothetical protein